jgi:hypothetical protein
MVERIPASRVLRAGVLSPWEVLRLVDAAETLRPHLLPLQTVGEKHDAAPSVREVRLRRNDSDPMNSRVAFRMSRGDGNALRASSMVLV